MTVANRLWHARFALGTNVYGPTPAQRESYRIGHKLYDEIARELDAINREWLALKEAMNAARVPWTPGR